MLLEGEGARRSWILASAASIFCAVVVLRLVDDNASNAVLGLNVVPVAIVAFYFGWRAGLAAGWIALCAVVVWAIVRDPELTALGWAIRALTYLGTGVLVGLFADHLRRSRLAERRSLERAERVERERAEEARRAAAAERARLARELHDIVGHTISVMTIQAEAAGRVIETDRAAASRAVSAIARSGREALVELRRLVGILQADIEDVAEGELRRTGVDRLAGLAEELRGAGLPVEVRFEGRRRPLPQAVDLSAYRIVQESLTNVMKHAPGARVEVFVRYGERELVLEVADAGGGGHSNNGASERRGHGLVGMNERVVLLGGRFRCGPREGGGYSVVAALPLG